MSNVNSVLVAIMNAGVTDLAKAVKTSRTLDGLIYSSAAMISAVAAYRIGRAWNLGETAEVKETKFSNALTEFQMHYITAGNPVWRESEDLPEFKAVAREAGRKEVDKIKLGAAVRAYAAACKAAKLTKKEHAIAEVQRFAKKIVDDAAANHAGFMKEIAAKENVQEILEVWKEFVAKHYGTSIYSLAAYFKAPAKVKAPGAPVDIMSESIDNLLKLTSVEEIAAMIKKLQARKDELEAASIAAIAASEEHAKANAGRDAETSDETVAPEAERIAA
jgi:hypothetical protein